MPRHTHRPLRGRFALLMLPVVLAACGGGGDSGAETPPAAAECSVAGQKAWLSSYMDDWYFWYRISPRPDAAAFPDVASYFNALLYTGGSTGFPRDRWSGSQTTESFNRLFGDGESLGYGVSVAGLELDRDPQRPLFVRHVEPLSPAASQGVARGDEVIALNGRSAAELIAADDFSVLSPQQAGTTLTLQLRRQGVDRMVTLGAAVFGLSPVTGTTIVTTAGGRPLGYVAVKDMISQALTPLDAAFTRFRAQGVQDLVLDLRYNGGGLVSTGGTLASYVAGLRGRGQNYASLLYNDKRTSNNTSFRFSEPAAALDLPRVFVLMGRRTCSASEQVINGLRGVGVEVVAIGEASCGKPVGFLPASSCGRTYSVVNFESVNQRNEGRYFDGFAPTCSVAEDFRAPQGSSADPLMAAAQALITTGFCPAVAAAAAPGEARALGFKPTYNPARVLDEGDARPGMLPR